MSDDEFDDEDDGDTFRIDGDRPVHEVIEEVNQLLFAHGLKFEEVDEGKASWVKYRLAEVD